VKLLLDEMYPSRLAIALGEQDIAAMTVAELGLTGRPDADIFAAACDGGYAVLTENVSDFARIAGEHLARGGHHGGVLIALSSRFSRRPAGHAELAAAIAAVAGDQLDDRLVYLQRADRA
jgi:Domain of unknown function (DUF5615)